MNKDEAIKEIISKPKYYVGVMPQSTASNFVASWRKGMSKQSTIDDFLKKFGYVKIKEAQYHKSYGKTNKLNIK